MKLNIEVSESWRTATGRHAQTSQLGCRRGLCFPLNANERGGERKADRERQRVGERKKERERKRDRE